jgi:hypothetical protein
LAGLVNVLLVELFIRKAYGDAAAATRIADDISYVVLPAISVLLWWALERRIKRLRRLALEGSLTRTAGDPNGRSSSSPQAARAEASGETVAIEFSKHAA